MLELNYTHCDVFTNQQMSGNSLGVFYLDKHPSEYDDTLLLSITKEMKHFESIFIHKQDLNHSYIKDQYPTVNASARIFTCSEELDFAGHPILGAASAIHHKFYSNYKIIKVQLSLNNQRTIVVNVNKTTYGYNATMSQGKPEFISTVESIQDQREFMRIINLSNEDLDHRYPMEVISTGLKYLIIPVKSHDLLSKVKIFDPNLKQLLAKYNADLTYIVDINTKTARSIENDGRSEDSATGSAAGPLGAYMLKHGIILANEICEIYQGEFIGRKSIIKVQVKDNYEDIQVTGGVCMFGDGVIKLV